GNVHFSALALDQNRKKIGDVLRDGVYSQPALVPTNPWLDNSSPAAPKDVRVDRVSATATQPASAAKKPEPYEEKPATTRSWYPLTPPAASEKPLASVRVAWSSGSDGERAFVWAVHYRQGDDWKMAVIPGDENDVILRDSSAAGPATRV